VEVRNKAWAEELKVQDRLEEDRGLYEEEKERRRALTTDLEVAPFVLLYTVHLDCGVAGPASD
jgi:hypothetical protein